MPAYCSAFVSAGFTERWGVLWCFFAPSPAAGGAPAGIVVMLLHRMLIGVAVGVLDGASVASQRAQTTALLVLFALAALYVVWVVYILPAPFCDR